MHKQFLDFLADFSRKHPQFEALVDSVGKAYGIILEADSGYTARKDTRNIVSNEQIDRFRGINPEWSNRSDSEVRAEILRRRNRQGGNGSVKRMSSIWDTAGSPKMGAAGTKKMDGEPSENIVQTPFEKRKHDAIVDAYNRYVDKMHGRPKYTLAEYAKNRIDYLNSTNAERIAREGSGSYRMINFDNVFPEFKKEGPTQLRGDTETGKFHPGNRVKAIAGEYVGLPGEVINATEQEAKVKFRLFNMKMDAVVPTSDLELITSSEPISDFEIPFKAGDTVEIINGDYVGMKGSVVECDADEVTVSFHVWGAIINKKFPVNMVIKSDDVLPSDTPKA